MNGDELGQVTLAETKKTRAIGRFPVPPERVRERSLIGLRDTANTLNDCRVGRPTGRALERGYEHDVARTTGDAR